MHTLLLEVRTAVRNVSRQYRRSLFGMSAVAFGVLALILAAGFIDWVFWATREGTIQTGLGHIHIVKPGYMDNGQSDPFRYLMRPDAQRLSELKAFPHVRTVAPKLAFTGLISHGDATLAFLGEGVSPQAELDLSRALPIPTGKNLSSEAPDGIIIGRGLAENLGVKVGDKVALVANTQSGGINAVEAVVRGTFTTVSKAYDDSALRVPLPLAQKLLRTDALHRWILMLEDTAQTEETSNALRTQLANSKLEVVPWYDQADFYKKVVTLMSKQVGLMELIIGAIIVLSISNTMMMSVIERTSEIGTAMALGRTRRQILRQFIMEGVTIGFIGGGLGLIAGWLLSMLISWIGIPMPPPPGMSVGYSGKILFSAHLGMEAFGLALITTLCASLYPAWKASRLGIVDALRHNR